MLLALCFAAPSSEYRSRVCALVTMMMMTAGRVRRRWSRREEMGWRNKSHGRLDKTREATRQLGWCGVV